MTKGAPYHLPRLPARERCVQTTACCEGEWCTHSPPATPPAKRALAIADQDGDADCVTGDATTCLTVTCGGGTAHCACAASPMAGKTRDGTRRLCEG